MPTVNAGSSVTLTLSATDAYTVSTVGEAYVDLLAGAPGSPSESPRIVNGSLRFGPYGVAAQIRVRAVSGAADYATYAAKGPVLATAAEAAAFQSMVSGPWNTVGWLGNSQFMNSGNPVTPSAVAYSAASGVLTVTHAAHGLVTGTQTRFGMLGQPQYNTNPVTGGLAIVDDVNTFRLQLAAGLSGSLVAANCRWHRWGHGYNDSIISLTRSLAGDRFTMGPVAAMTGETLAQIRARIPTEIAPYVPAGGVVVVEGGYNDALTGVALAQAISDMQGITSDLAALGIRVIWIACTALGSGYATTAVRAFLVELNRAIRATVGQTKTAAMVGADVRSVDSTTNFNALANYLNSDNLHWAPRLTKLIATDLAAVLAVFFPSATPRLPQSALDCYDATNNPSAANKMQNATLATTTGGTINNSIVPGTTMGSQWNVATTSGSGANMTASVQAASWGVGNSAKLTLTSNITFASDVVRIYASSQHARFSCGQKVRVGIRAKTSGFATFLRYLSLFLFTTVDGVTQSIPVANGYGASDAVRNDQSDPDLVMIGDAWIPAGVSLTSLYPQLTAFVTGTVLSGAFIEAGQIELTPIG